MGKFFKGFLVFLGVGLLSAVIALPIYSKHKGYSNVFDYIGSWPVFEDKEKTSEDEIVDDNLNGEADDSENDSSEDETNTETEEDEIPEAVPKPAPEVGV